MIILTIIIVAFLLSVLFIYALAEDGMFGWGLNALVVASPWLVIFIVAGMWKLIELAALLVSLGW